VCLPRPKLQIHTKGVYTINYLPVKATFLQDLHDRIYEQAQALIARRGARPDGYVYTVDLSQFLAYAALNKDRRLYTPLRDFAVRHLILTTVQIPTWGLSSGATGRFSRCIGNHRSSPLGPKPLVG